jgi:hypothetical protein
MKILLCADDSLQILSNKGCACSLQYLKFSISWIEASDSTVYTFNLLTIIVRPLMYLTGIGYR